MVGEPAWSAGQGPFLCLLVYEDEGISARQSGKTDSAYHCLMDLTILKDLRLRITVLPSDRDTKASLPVQRFGWKGVC